MDTKRESGDVLEHMPLEEVKLEEIHYREPPEEWEQESHHKESYLPPVLIEEQSQDETVEGGLTKKYSLLAHHRSFWRAITKGPLSIRVLVVRSSVHIPIAHRSIENCTEEALLFDGLLRNGLCENRSRLSDLLGYSRARITQILNLLKLPSEMRRKLLLADDISEFQLRPLVRISNTKQQMTMFTHLIQGKLTGRQMALFAGNSKEKGESVTDIEEDMAQTDDRDLDISDLMKEEAPMMDSSVGKDIESRTARLQKLIESIGSLRSKGWEERALTMGADEIDMLMLQGVSLLRSGLYQQAVDFLKRVIQTDPDCAPAYYYLGRCGNLTGDFEFAERSLRTALEFIPDQPDYLMELAIVLEKLRRNTEASTFYRKAGTIRRGSSEDEHR